MVFVRHLGSHVTFYKEINKISAAHTGHVVSRKWVHQNGGSKHGPIVCDLKILRFGRASRNNNKILKYYLKFWTSF